MKVIIVSILLCLLVSVGWAEATFYIDGYAFNSVRDYDNYRANKELQKGITKRLDAIESTLDKIYSMIEELHKTNLGVAEYHKLKERGLIK